MRRIASVLALMMVMAACSSGATDETTSTAAPTSAPETTRTTTQPEKTTTTTVPETTTTTQPLREGDREFAYVVGIEVSDDGTVIVTADYAQFLTGDEAIQAAIEDGFIVEGETVPNDYYIVNENPQLRELALDPDAPIVLNVCFVDGECVTEVGVTVGQWVALDAGETPDGLPEGFQWYGEGSLPYWLILDGETIVGVQEQYLP
jgi:glucose/arabinose dehydrogenase